MKAVREFDCDNEELEEFIGVIQTEFHHSEDRLLEAMIVQVIKDCRLELCTPIHGRMTINPLVTDAFMWLMIEDPEDVHVEMTFAWICNELGWHPENFRRPLRKKYLRLLALHVEEGGNCV